MAIICLTILTGIVIFAVLFGAIIVAFGKALVKLLIFRG